MKRASLGEVTLSLESGSRPKGGVSTDGGDVPSIGGEHIGEDGGFRFENLKRISSEFFSGMRSGRVKVGDILIVKDGATTGRTSYVPVGFPFQEAAVNEHVFCLRIDPQKADPKFVFHYLRSPVGQAGVMSDFRGATVGGISRDFVNKAKLLLPSQDEQRRVAALLDKADGLRAKRREVLNQFERLTQSTFFNLFGDPVRNEKSWPTATLGDVCCKITDGTHKTPKYVEDGVEFLSAKDIKKGRVVWGSGKFISPEEHSDLVRRCNPEMGDLLLAKSGSLGEVAVIDRSHDFSLFESLCLLKPNRAIVGEHFLASLLRAPSMLSHLLGKNKGVAIRHLHLVDVRGLKIIVPPLPVQRDFERRVRTIESLASLSRASSGEAERLFTSIQRNAFRA